LTRRALLHILCVSISLKAFVLVSCPASLEFHLCFYVFLNPCKGEEEVTLYCVYSNARPPPLNLALKYLRS